MALPFACDRTINFDYRRDVVSARATTGAGLIQMKRREFIGIAAVGAAGVVVPALARCDASVAATLAHPRLLELLHDDQIVRDLGRRYREIVPAEDSADTLVHAIMAGEAAEFSIQHRAAPSLCARVHEQVRRDFASGNTVTINGWILSVTEARQCALNSLLPA